MLSLSEQLLLLGLNDEKGSVVFSASTALPYGLAGAILLELFFLGKITFKQNTIKVIDASKTSNDIINDALALLKSENKPRETKYWVTRFCSKISKLQERLATQLVEKKVLNKEQHSFMWVINYNRYPTKDTQPELDIRCRIKDIVLKRAIPSEQEVALISLIKACELTNEIFTKQERDKAKKRIAVITEKQAVSSVISQTMEEITTAIMMVIIASAVTTTVIN